jgi:membrane carboxypeptidase/penicillin-binding protein
VKKKTRQRLRLARSVAIAAAVLALAAAGAWLRAQVRDTPAKVRRAFEHAPERVDAAALPERWRTILLTVEDPGFYSHPGIRVWTAGAGAPTITQRLAQQLYFDRFRPGWRAVPATMLAVALDRRLDKNRQLDLFLSTAYFGTLGDRDLVGFPAAARDVYGKRLARLTDDEFTSLVAMLLAPNELDPRTHAADHGERLRRIQRLLRGECDPPRAFDPDLDGCAAAR